MNARLFRIFCLLALALTLAAAPALADTRLMLATDMHYLDPQFFEGSDRLARGALLGDGRMPQESAAWLRGLVQEAIAQKPDALVLLGDQTFNGEVLSHRAVSDALAEIEAAGIPVIVIPGNHDINNSEAFAYLEDAYKPVHSIPLERYGKYYAAYGLDEALFRDEASMSYVAQVGDLWVLMIDAGIYEPYREAYGLVEPSTAQWIDEVLGYADEAGVPVITVSHQSMLPHSDRVTAGYMIINWEQVSDLLISHGVRLHLSGHTHIQHIAEKDGLYDVSLSSLSAWPHHFALATVRCDDSIGYQALPLGAEFLPNGLREESEGFFLEVSHRKSLESLDGLAIDEDEKEQMATFAAWVNMNYYAGRVCDIQEKALADPAYALWLDKGADTFWAGYLPSMLEDERATQEMYFLELP